MDEWFNSSRYLFPFNTRIAEYYKGALLLVNLHYATDAVYHVCGICWIGGWKGACIWSFRVWSLLFVTTRVIILEWSFHTNDTFFCIVQVALSIWLFWSFTVLHLAKLGYIKSERNFNASGELKVLNYGDWRAKPILVEEGNI